MSLKIKQDHSRFKQIVRGKIKQNLKKYIQKGEMVGKKGKDLVTIPLPTIDIPHFKFGAKAIEGKKFDWQSNDRLRRALELKLFEDQKDSIKLKTLVSAVVDKETQEKIDIIKSHLIRYFGYNEVSATDVLNYVASIFARGDAKE